jgi:hypothetical protein
LRPRACNRPSALRGTQAAKGRRTMSDLIFFAVTLAFFAVAGAYVFAAEKL